MTKLNDDTLQQGPELLAELTPVESISQARRHGFVKFLRSASVLSVPELGSDMPLFNPYP